MGYGRSIFAAFLMLMVFFYCNSYCEKSIPVTGGMLLAVGIILFCYIRNSKWYFIFSVQTLGKYSLEFLTQSISTRNGNFQSI